MYTEDQIRDMIMTYRNAAERAVVSLFEQQTDDEQATAATKEHNGRGFNGLDAAFGTSLATQVMADRHFSDKQLAAARKMLQKYIGQLTRIANAKRPEPTESPLNTKIADVTRLWVQAHEASHRVETTGIGWVEMNDLYHDFGEQLVELKDMMQPAKYIEFCRYLGGLVGINASNVNPTHVAATVVADANPPSDDPDWDALACEHPAGAEPAPHMSAAEALNLWAKKSGGRKPYVPVLAAH